ncbi:hypothetical protein L596_027660 [Steinernema carpocapsae]|uniref:Uncharacterized protein n=1 Tax=Steinernema carpocapsae TaxID=34508 RepID=A0A4U5LW64_STECR|nr:hypothetical protein L596_027660 [Steinernema carpocapsae]
MLQKCNRSESRQVCRVQTRVASTSFAVLARAEGGRPVDEVQVAMPPGPTKSSEAPRILSDSCFLFNDLIDQLIDNGNMVAKRNSTKHYWKRSRFESTTDASYASESNASPATDRSSDATDVIYSSGDEHDVTKEALTTRSSKQFGNVYWVYRRGERLRFENLSGPWQHPTYNFPTWRHSRNSAKGHLSHPLFHY